MTDNTLLSKRRPLLTIRAWMLTTAMASFLTELVLAHITSILWGGVIAKYTLSTGLFILALGLGSLYNLNRSAAQTLVWQQALMAGLALISPWWILWPGTHLPAAAGWSAAALSIFAVGFVSGMEFPALAKLAEARTNKDRDFVFADLLRMDYLGMGLSALIFPMILLRHIGIFKAAALAATLNLLVAQSIFMLNREEFPSRRLRTVLICSLVAGFALVIAYWFGDSGLVSISREWLVQ